MDDLLDITLDRVVTFNNEVYKIVEILGSNTLLVVKKEDFEENKFPLQTFVIPGR